jgi:hypothetical protein
MDVIVERKKLRLCADAGASGPIRVGFEDRIHELQPGECRDNQALSAAPRNACAQPSFYIGAAGRGWQP